MLADAGSLEDGRTVALGEVLEDGVTTETMDPPLALFEVHRARWRVPVHRGMTPPVEVDALLSDAGRGEDKGPEGTVERLPQLGLSCALGVVGPLVAIA